MADHLFAKVREEGRSIRTLQVRVRYNDMAEDQASESLLEPTDLETDVYGRLRALLRARLEAAREPAPGVAEALQYL